MDQNWLCQRAILAPRKANVYSRQALQLRHVQAHNQRIRGLLEKYPTFGREKETGLLGALDT